MHEKYRIISYVRFALMLLLLNVAFYISFYIRFKIYSGLYDIDSYLILLLFSNIFYMISAMIFKNYELNVPFDDSLESFKKTIKVFGLFLFFYTLFIVSIKGYMFSRIFHLYFLSFLLIFIILFEFIFSLYLIPNILKNKKFLRNVLVIGSGKTAMVILEKLRSSNEYNIVGYIDNEDRGIKNLGISYRGRIDEFEKVVADIKSQGISLDDVFITESLEHFDDSKDFIRICEKNFILVRFVPNLHDIFKIKNLKYDFFENIPIFTLNATNILKIESRIVKRIFDLFFSCLVLLLVLSWLIPFLWLLYKIFMPGPLFFIQDRIGKNNKIFKCYKFRTMKVDASNNKNFIPTVRDDQRVTRLGRFLRKANIDELAQFINVFLGDMSVVGPRAHAITFQNKYKEYIEHIDIRQKVKPGITGWAQVNGFRGDHPDDEKNSEWIRKRVEYDLWYIENWSFWLDIKIIFLTVYKIFRGDPNAY